MPDLLGQLTALPLQYIGYARNHWIRAHDIHVDNFGLNLFIFIFIRQKRQHSMKRRFYYLNCK